MKLGARGRRLLNPPAPPPHLPICPFARPLDCLVRSSAALVRQSIHPPNCSVRASSALVCPSARPFLWHSDCLRGVHHVCIACAKHRPLLDALPGLTYPSSCSSHWAPSLCCAFKESGTAWGSKDFGKLE